ncbi:bifunctional diguanylate cyclase/phosphodiesterase [Synechococcus elongatus]|uniref:Diguanylate cyclase/phosphodiesterase n=1 Tax=Synechococcus elongatus (strain ATCC 33912 / PCC 7942 / FACHB-805) TaxID=1140 RepID=Q31K70_SYNE7|nr:EAL domain-containing protein [Synechococcus elongatus]ABB58549.1 diguanylate cyclase/phosphodiesterase [Synechococcus elongatus PCC 7942 = FACHB-805]MBD2587268.1 EAL domain-containing protein [Synechococcus elongatus FACHB-242]MBD2688337.1 EAL domain-containing protein [Synechococcus elongatus FACHB-1061]MBD2705951.1 EAL domain-containing protein [Synechococcus elongatus PCC 7942 = FACHB-805]UOW72346.1 diguanylate cyclase/phosphodiesterase [Synechococcus elongatus PCC 7943]
MLSFFSWIPLPRLRDWPAITLAAGVHILISQFAYSYISFTDAKVTPIWPSAGVLLAALFLAGPQVWPGIFIGDFLLKLMTGLGVGVSLSGAVANASSRLVAYAIAKRAISRSSRLQTLDEVWTLLAAAVAQATVSALIGATGNCLFGAASWNRFFTIGWTWWTGNASSAILFFPVVLLWCNQWRQSLQLSAKRWLELFIISAIILAIATLAFASKPYPVSSLVIPVFVWLALRFNSTWVSTGITFITLFAFISTANGKGQFSVLAVNEALILLQSYNSSIAVMSFSLNAVISQARNSQTYLRQILDHLPIGVAVHELTGRMTYVNAVGREILRGKYKSATLEEMAKFFNIYQASKNRLTPIEELPLAMALQGQLSHTEDLELRWPDRTIPLEVWGIPIHDETGHIKEGMTVFQDIHERLENARLIQQANEQLSLTVQELEAANHKLEQEASERQQAQAQLWHLAHFDTLTQLPNRAYFVEQLHAWFNRYKADHQYPFAVLFLDCDRFKIVNDSLGHSAGDVLLTQVAQRLQSCIASPVIFARLGGDEFGVLVPAQDPGYPQDLAEQLHELIVHPFEIQGQRIYIGVSIGISFVSAQIDAAEELLRSADTAMYAAKRNPLSRGIQIFSAKLSANSLKNLALETALREAIKQADIDLFYQPIVDLETGALVGAEALARWFHPELGNIPPLEFVTLAERSKLIFSLGNFILEKACLQIHLWQQDHLITPGDFILHVNISAQQICHEDFEDWIKDILQRTEISAQNLMLEITESSVAEDIDQQLLKLLDELKSMGVQLSIDDFGTGYSSLSYLQRLPVNSLKIDRSFIHQINLAGDNRQVAQATIALAHSFGLEVVAEGIEEESQLYWLRQLGCDMGQGYYFSKPLSAADMTEFLRCHGSASQTR